jgi:teichuronic acid biosynthesis glycosyltransferase TuaH
VENFQQVRTQKYPRPKELEGRSGQVIGFVGNLDMYRIDYLLLKKIAVAYPDKTLLIIGPINSTGPKDVGLDQLPNVILAGSRRLQELPPLMQHMDCVLIPFQVNRMTNSIYPLKINEYLAAGKPVVSTGFSDDIRTFAECIYLAENHDQFVQLISTALAENDPALVQRRTEVANSNTWEARIKQLWEVVEKRGK